MVLILATCVPTPRKHEGLFSLAVSHSKVSTGTLFCCVAPHPALDPQCREDGLLGRSLWFLPGHLESVARPALFPHSYPLCHPRKWGLHPLWGPGKCPRGTYLPRDCHKGLFWGLLGDAHASWWCCHGSPSYSSIPECARSESGGGGSGPLGSSSTHVLVLAGSWEPGIQKDLPFCLSLPRLYRI